VRYPRGQGPGTAIEAAMRALPIGRAEVRRRGQSGLLLLSFGTMLAAALVAGERLDATVVNMRFVKPLDEALLAELVPQHVALVTIEENVVAGGAGGAVAECLDARGLAGPRLHIGIPDQFIEHGSRSECVRDAGLDTPAVAARIAAWWQLQAPALNTGLAATRMA
jgi:1-deoxy-D-xylulose-5-phosphate synthase